MTAIFYYAVPKMQIVLYRRRACSLYFENHQYNMQKTHIQMTLI